MSKKAIPQTVISPSNLEMFRDCPKKFEARYITKKVKFQQSQAAARGDRLHHLLESTLKNGAANAGYTTKAWNKTTKQYDYTTHAGWQENELPILAVAKPTIDRLYKLRDKGWELHTELEAATNGLGEACGWWDDNCYLRSKSDVVVVSPDRSHGLIIDWKTGKTLGKDSQFECNALTLAPVFGKIPFQGWFFYLDQKGKTQRWRGQVDIHSPKVLAAQDRARSKMAETLTLMNKLVLAHVSNTFVPTPSFKVCKWCDYVECSNKIS